MRWFVLGITFHASWLHVFYKYLNLYMPYNGRNLMQRVMMSMTIYPTVTLNSTYYILARMEFKSHEEAWEETCVKFPPSYALGF